jgi:hypothetical protein
MNKKPIAAIAAAPAIAFAPLIISTPVAHACTDIVPGFCAVGCQQAGVDCPGDAYVPGKGPQIAMNKPWEPQQQWGGTPIGPGGLPGWQPPPPKPLNPPPNDPTNTGCTSLSVYCPG